ncbi:unnamed protein product, partial [Rotaria magnacalcarata]
FNYLIIITKEDRKQSSIPSSSSSSSLTRAGSATTLKPQSTILSQLTANQTTTELQTLAVYDT